MSIDSALTTKTSIVTALSANVVFATVNITDILSDWIGIIGGSVGIVVGIFVSLKNYEHWRDARRKRIENE